MENQSFLFVVAATVIGFLAGFLLSRAGERRKVTAAVEAATEQGRASAAVDVATLKERVRAHEEEREQTNRDRDGLKSALELVRSDLAQVRERASRVISLDAQIAELLNQQKSDRQEVLRLSTSEAEKSQSLQDVSDRLIEAEKGVAASDKELAETRHQAANLREESGRLNAEVKAERDAQTVLLVKFQEEKDQRLRAETLNNTLAAELAELNKQRAVFEVDSNRIPALEEKLTDAERMLAEFGKQAADLRETSGRVNAELKAERETLAAIRSDFLIEKNQRESAETRANKLSTEVAELNSRLESEHSQAEEKLALLLDAKEALSNQFKTLANDILEEKAKRFTEQNQTNIGQLLDPLRTKLQEFQGKVEEVYVQEGKDRTALAEQVRQLMDLNQVLSQDAKNLTSALKGSSKTQGNWGELILERVLEASGLRKGHEYDVQESHTREDGSRAQPDVVVHLPEDRHLIVDAKVSLVAYDACASAEDDAERAIAVKRHLDSVRTHMKGLSDKNYQALYGLKSLDFVLMFIPIEPAFMVAITHDRDLYMEALNKNVLLVSPSTLLFVVRTVAHLWRQEAQSKNAQEIAKRGADLYDRLSAFVADLDKVGDRLRQTQESYTDARNKLLVNKGNVIRQAEMLKQLGVKPTKSIPDALVDAASVEDGTVVEAVTTVIDFKQA